MVKIDTKITKFISDIAALIQSECKKRGYHMGVAPAIIAQACLESGYGRSVLASKYHNYFGMKCGSRCWTGASVNMKTKEEYTKGTLTSVRDNFRAYGSMEEGVKGYFDFISTKRYAELKNCANPESYLITIKNAGYATSHSYVSNCMNIIKQNGLEKYSTYVLVKLEKPQKTAEELALEIRRGDYGNGRERQLKCTELYGWKLYQEARALVNEYYRRNK